MNKNQTQEAGTDYLKKLAEAQLHIREAEALDGGTGNFAELIAEAKAERRAIKRERAEKRAARAQMEKTYYVSFEGGTFAYVQATSQEDAEEAALELPNTETILEVLDTRPSDPEWPPVELEDRLANREAELEARAKDAWNANRTLSLNELRDVLFELVQAESQNGNEWVSKDMVHIAKEVKYGKIVSTAGITGAKMVTENGARHIILTTTN